MTRTYLVHIEEEIRGFYFDTKVLMTISTLKQLERYREALLVNWRKGVNSSYESNLWSLELDSGNVSMLDLIEIPKEEVAIVSKYFPDCTPDASQLKKLDLFRKGREDWWEDIN